MHTALPEKLLARTGIAPSLVLIATGALAQTADLRLPISLDADSTAYDGESSMLMFQGLRLTQGNIGIVADEGFASQLDFEDSVWHFSGNVAIDTESGHIESDTADLRFQGYQLKLATITGSPATFEMRRPDSDQVTYAEAGKLKYDFAAGVVEFSDQATITEGGNQISSSYLVYNITERRINASSGGEDDDKVRIIYTPGSEDSLFPGQEPEPEEPEPEEPEPEEPGPDEDPDAEVTEDNGDTG